MHIKHCKGKALVTPRVFTTMTNTCSRLEKNLQKPQLGVIFLLCRFTAQQWIHTEN